MVPKSSRDFLRAAAQRLTAAQALFDMKLNLDAQYLGGYVVECAMKALILHRTPKSKREGTLQALSAGKKMHDAEVLLGKLRTLHGPEPPALRQWISRYQWTTDLRYETGRRNTAETRNLLRTADAIFKWVENQLS